MVFDQTSVLDLAKLALTKDDKRRTDDLRLAMSAACDEMVLRLRSHSFIRSYTSNLAINTRSTTLTGEEYDLKYIFALKIGSGDEQQVLIPVDEQQFLRDYDNPSESASLPTHYSILVANDNGYPTIKFNCPLESPEVLTVYYYIDITTENVSAAKSITAITAGTLAYFFGTKSEQGAQYHNEFKEMCALMRGADTFDITKPKEFTLSREDKNIRSTFRNLQLDRK